MKWPKTWPQELPALRDAFRHRLIGFPVLILDTDGLLLHGAEALLQSVQTNQAIEMSLYTGVPRGLFERSGWHELLNLATEQYAKRGCKGTSTFFRGIDLTEVDCGGRGLQC
jgi:hypothetical protein